MLLNKVELYFTLKDFYSNTQREHQSDNELKYQKNYSKLNILKRMRSSERKKRLHRTDK